jgi:hypothetical protein
MIDSYGSAMYNKVDLMDYGYVEDNVLYLRQAFADQDEFIENVLNVTVNELAYPEEPCGFMRSDDGDGDGEPLANNYLVKTENYSKFFGVGTGKIVIQNEAKRILVKKVEDEEFTCD